jgi:putative phage-type endonuclease
MSNAIQLAQPYTIVCDTDDRDEWLSHRLSGIGASEISGVLGLPGSASRLSPLKVYCLKTGAIEADDLSDVEAVEWGHIMEPVIAAEYARRTGRPVEPGRRGRHQILRSTRYPWAMCSLDYWTADNDNGERRPLEVKNVSAFLSEDWLNGTPDYYYAQVQQQLLVTGAAKATSACCLGGNRLLWCDVPRDDVMIRKIIYHGELMWQRIEQRTPPDPDGSEATKTVLHRLYGQDDGSTVVLPAALESIVYEWRDVKAKISELEKREKALSNAIKATMGPAQQGVFPGGDRVSWVTHQTKEYTVKAGSKRPLLFHPSK